jgi:hypothetical protein
MNTIFHLGGLGGIAINISTPYLTSYGAKKNSLHIEIFVVVLFFL